MHLFYTPGINSINKEFLLNEEESKHCINVLRLTTGSEIKLVDGIGGLYTAKISVANPKKTLLLITEYQHNFQKRNHYLHIAVAPTKNIDRFEWFLEKATEIGIDEITPLICNRSERKEIKVDRLNKIIISAAKQSYKAFLPKLNDAVDFGRFLTSHSFNGQKFIAHCEDGLKTNLASEILINGSYLILIGPEGDFTPAEIRDSEQSGFFAISLGESRLRTETAALEVCFEINFLNR